MRRVIQYGYTEKGEFEISVVEESPGMHREESRVYLTRAECQKISKHMQFGKKGEERVIETVNGEEVK